MKLFQTILVIVATLSPVSFAAAAEAIVSQTIAGASNGAASDQTLGWRFHLNSPAIVTSVGVFDLLGDGFGESHDVGIWTSSGSLLVSANLAAGESGTLLGSFRYADVVDVSLPIGDYVIASHFKQPLLDGFSDFNSGLVTHPFVEYQGRNGIGPGFQFPSQFLGADGLNYITSNFQFEAVPEPSAIALIGFGGMFVAIFRRSVSRGSMWQF